MLVFFFKLIIILKTFFHFMLESEILWFKYSTEWINMTKKVKKYFVQLFL